jgi:hypothetical protein
VEARIGGALLGRSQVLTHELGRLRFIGGLIAPRELFRGLALLPARHFNATSDDGHLFGTRIFGSSFRNHGKSFPVSQLHPHEPNGQDGPELVEQLGVLVELGDTPTALALINFSNFLL